MRGKSSKLGVLIAFSLPWLTVGTAIAKKNTWYKYESAYFEAYSDASEKKVYTLLEELENYRAAVSQILTFEIPPGAAKTQVIILRSSRDFRKITDDRLVGAFVVGLAGIPHIIMPVGLGNDWSQIAIRHEYAHVLLAYSGHRFPHWYQEGFAEFMSGTNFRDKGTKFTIGDATGRQMSSGALVPWDDLTADDFEFHSIRAKTTMSNAYFQSWLLVHYLMIGERFKYYEKLGDFLGRFSKGESSQSAFKAVFGMTATQIGNRVIQQYSSRTPYYEFEFKPGVQDHSFDRSVVDAADVRSTIADIQDVFIQGREEPRPTSTH